MGVNSINQLFTNSSSQWKNSGEYVFQLTYQEKFFLSFWLHKPPMRFRQGYLEKACYRFYFVPTSKTYTYILYIVTYNYTYYILYIEFFFQKIYHYYLPSDKVDSLGREQWLLDWITLEVSCCSLKAALVFICVSTTVRMSNWWVCLYSCPTKSAVSSLEIPLWL